MKTFEHAAGIHATPVARTKTPGRTPSRNPAIRSIILAPVQPKLKIGAVDDPAEAEADRIADEVMRMPDPAAGQSTEPDLRRQSDEEEDDLQMKPADTVRRKCAECAAEEEGLDTIRRKCAACAAADQAHCGPDMAVRPDSSSARAPPTPHGAEAAIDNLGPGHSLPGAERAFFEPRLGRALSDVRIHTGAQARQASRNIGARAFALGNNIAFADGEFAPGTVAGRHLIAHELAHTLQRGGGPAVRRYCSDPDFCTPYPTSAEADAADESIWDYYMIFEGAVSFGSDVRSLYESYLNRSPGDSLAPRIFKTDGAYMHDLFRDSGDIEDDMDAVLDLVGDRLSRGPGYPWRGSAYSSMSLSNFLSTSEMDNRPINFSNPFSVAGHIAGGIGGSDAGDDYRKITYANVGVERTELIGGTGYFTLTLTPHYEVFDAIDFCPGDCGSSLEQLITIPMSRLEKSGRAYDQPFKVIFSPEPRTTRVWF